MFHIKQYGGISMKKIISCILILAFVFSFSSCTIKEKEESAEKEYNYPRTEDVSSEISDNSEEFSYSADMDFDGKKEDIRIRYETSNSQYEWCSDMKITMADYECTITEIEGRDIWAVYVCDMDTNDGVRDLAVITVEGSGDPVLRIFKYKNDLPLYKFKNKYGGEDMDCTGTGYAITPYFNVNDDDTFTLEEQTDSYGMWSVYKTYKPDSQGVYAEVEADIYDVLPDFMERYNNPEDIMMGEVEEKEKEMWKKGYIKAHCDYTSNDFTISEGEYLKVVLDDGNNNIFVEKENGESGWMNIDFDAFDRDAFNRYFFFLAG